MKIQWLVEEMEYDPAEFSTLAVDHGREEVGPGVWRRVIEEPCLGVQWTFEDGLTVKLFDATWFQPQTEFRIIP